MKNKIGTYIDLFSGCGGLSLGLHKADWQGIFAIEKSPDAFKTLKHNLISKSEHFAWPEWLSCQPHDINQVLKNNKHNLFDLRGKVDLVAGGPPCQGFSTAGLRNEGDHRNKLIDAYVKFIRYVQPKIIFFENVKGFTQQFSSNVTKGKTYSEYVKRALSRSSEKYDGYKVFGKLVDFSGYGVPQRRTRFILVGVRKDLAKQLSNDMDYFFKLIEDAKSEFLHKRGLSHLISVRSAISDLETMHGIEDSNDTVSFRAGKYGYVGSAYQKYLRNGERLKNKQADSHRFTKHGKETVNLFKRLLKSADRNRKISGEERDKFGIKKRGLTVLCPEQPTPTLTTHPDDYVHYKEPRILTVREYARVQTFPDWYEFKGKYTTGGKLRVKEVPRYSQIGNAIPPLFAELSGQNLKKILSNAE